MSMVSSKCPRIEAKAPAHTERDTETQRLTHPRCAARSSMSAVSTIGITAFSLAGRELAKVFVPRDVSVRMLVEALGAAAGISWDAWQLTWKGEALDDWSLQPFTADSELSSVELQVVLKPQPLQLEPEHEHAVELLEALKEPYDGLRGLSFALGSLRQLSLGAKDDDRCFKDCRGDDSSGVMSEPQLNALSRAVLDGRLQCTVLCLRGVLRPVGMMGRAAVHRQDSADLVSLLSHMPQLTSLDLSGNRLGFANTCIEALGTAMPNLQKLTYLNLSCNGFFSFHGGSGMLPPHVSALFVSLLNLTALEVLDLSLNDKAFVRDFCKEKEELGSSFLPRLLKELPALKKLLFAANDAGLSTVEALEATRQPGCEIDYGLEDHVAKALYTIQEPWEEGVFRLPLLDLEPVQRSWPVRTAYYWHLGCGLAAVEEGLRRRVASVDISGFKLGRSWPGLVKCVLAPHFSGLRELNLQKTNVAIDFLTALHQPAFASLRKIDLAGCGLCQFTDLGDDGPQIAQAFSFWSESLTDLDLSNNFISEYGDFSPGHLEHNLPPLVRSLKRLKRLALRDNDIGGPDERTRSLILDAFDIEAFQAACLEELDLQRNPLESPDWDELLDRLRAVVPQVHLGSGKGKGGEGGKGGKGGGDKGGGGKSGGKPKGGKQSSD
ncbi:unnamed protein product [Symbiodinium sp. CCMP2592]|nr:unnamed protein product [Symbiodinium sp. CCMP2592]